MKVFSKNTPVAEQVPPDALTAAREHLKKIQANEASINDIRQRMAASEAEIVDLRQRRGASPSPSINSEIAQRFTDRDALGDRLQFLRAESEVLRQDAQKHLPAFQQAHSQALTRAQEDYRTRLVAAVRNLTPILQEGAALGSAGCPLIAASLQSTIIADPRCGHHDHIMGFVGALIDGTFFADEVTQPFAVPEGAKQAIENLSAFRSLTSELQAVVDEVAGEARRRAEQTAAVKHETAPFSARYGGMPAPEDPERVAGNKLFPRTDYLPATQFPNNPERQALTAAHMNPSSEPVSEDPGAYRELGVA